MDDTPRIDAIRARYGSVKMPVDASGLMGRLGALRDVASTFAVYGAKGFAALVVVGVVGAGVMYRAEIGGWTEHFVAQTTGATVERIVVEGVVYTGKDNLQQALGLNRGDPLVTFNPLAARARLEALPWVRLASVERQLPNAVKVVVYEHTPLARVQDGEEIWVINKDGERIERDDKGTFAHLPLLRGTGADMAAAKLFGVMAAWPNLTGQMARAEYVGERRWNLTFTSGVTVMLPEDQPQVALETLHQLENARHVLTLNDGTVDLRLPDRIVLKLPEDVQKTPVTNKPDSQG